MRGNICEKLITRVCDTKSSVRLAALIALKALCQRGGDQVCSMLVKMDALTPLLDLFGKMRVDVAIKDEGLCQIVFGTVLEVLNVLYELCDRSEEAADWASRSPLCTKMVDFLDSSLNISLDMRCAAARLLQTLVDDCPSLVTAMKSGPKAVNLLKGVLDNSGSDVVLRSICAGIFLTLEGGTEQQVLNKCYGLLQPFLALRLPHVLLSMEQEIHAAADEMLEAQKPVEQPPSNRQKQKQPQVNPPPGYDGDEPPDMESKGASVDLPSYPKKMGPAQAHIKDALDKWTRSAEAQQQALETLTNLFCGVHPADSAVSRIANDAFAHLVYICTIPVTQIDAKLGDKLLSSLPQLDGCMEKVQQLQVTALACMNNVLISVDTSVLLKDQKLANFWPALISLLSTVSQSLAKVRSDGANFADDELYDNVSQCIWSLCRACSDGPNLPVNHGDGISVITKALSLHLSEGADISLAGTLGCLAGYMTKNSAALNGVSQVLAVCCNNDKANPLLIAESLNSLVDIFSDDNTHNTFASSGVGQKMNSALPIANKAIGALQNADDKEHMEEVIENVKAFLDYKGSK